MNRYFDYPELVWRYFQEVDGRFGDRRPRRLVRGDVAVDVSGLASGLGRDKTIKAVLWDIYGTLFGVGLGDLEQTLGYDRRLSEAGAVVVREFFLGESLKKLYAGKKPQESLRDRYLSLIAESHDKSRAEGVEYPEVVIEDIWQQILEECVGVGYQVSACDFLRGQKYHQRDFGVRESAYCCGYLFDVSLQQSYLYPGVIDCLERLRAAGVVQGILSNAQFYTPVHLRRLLRQGSEREDLELGDFFAEELILFSYELGYSKPSPGGFEKTIKALAGKGIGREEILYIGNDMLNDVWAAQRCGLKAMLFAGDRGQTVLRQDDCNCRGLQADAVVTEMAQIARLTG